MYGGLQGYGHLPDPPGHTRTSVHVLLQKLGVRVGTATPSSFSLRAKGAPVMDQGNTSACTGHAHAGAIFTSCANQGTPLPFVPSPMGLYTNGRCIDLAPGDALTDEGAVPNSVMRAANEFGIKPIQAPTSDGRYSDCEPATINTKPTFDDLEAEALHVAVGDYALDPSAPDFVATLRTVICAGYCVTFAVQVDAAMEAWNPASGPLGAPDTSALLGGHNIRCDGYHEDVAGNTIVDFVNSWGTGWGAAGYGMGGPAFYTPNASNPNLGWSAVIVLKVTVAPLAA